LRKPIIQADWWVDLLCGELFECRVSVKFLVAVLVTSALTLAACSVNSSDDGIKLRTQSENDAIRNSWFPIQSEECQLLVDSLGLVSVAIGNIQTDYLLENMSDIDSNLEETSRIVVPKLLELSQNTKELSIRAYALEAIPVLSRLDELVSDKVDGAATQIGLLSSMAELTGKVPDACKS
jgi:hypothetical protein